MRPENLIETLPPHLPASIVREAFDLEHETGTLDTKVTYLSLLSLMMGAGSLQEVSVEVWGSGTGLLC